MWKRGEGVVLKFGGTSVAGPERIRAVAERIASFARSGRKVVVVVSAMGNTTNNLIALARETAGGFPDRREMDQLLATGEQQSAALVAMVLREQGVPALSFTGEQAGFLAEGTWGEGRLLSVHPRRVEEASSSGFTVVVTGFQAVTSNGDVITLGRGGSDLSAVALAGALGAEACHIFTDVDGIYTADPRKVPSAQKIDGISWEECLEMTFCGAKVMQTRSIEMAERLEMPLCVASSFDEREGTWITGGIIDEKFQARAVISDENLAVLTVSGGAKIRAKVAEAFLHGGIQPFAMVEREELSFHIGRERIKEAASICRRFTENAMTVNQHVARVSVVGPGAGNHPEIGRTVLEVLTSLGTTVHLLTSSGLSVSCVVDEKDALPVLRVLHEKFIEKKGEFQCA